jgi:hypothetical protein
VAKSNLRKLLENSKIQAKHVNRPLIGSRGLANDEKYFLNLGRLCSNQIDCLRGTQEMVRDMQNSSKDH